MNPRPKRLWPNVYACSEPLISRAVCRSTGLSVRIRSVVREPDARAERFRPSPAELCRSGLAGVRGSAGGLYLGRHGVIVVRNYCFPCFLTRPTGVLDAQSGLHASRRNQITPEKISSILSRFCRSCQSLRKTVKNPRFFMVRMHLFCYTSRRLDECLDVF